MSPKCARCDDDTFWVCEAHDDRPWDTASAEHPECPVRADPAPERSRWLLTENVFLDGTAGAAGVNPRQQIDAEQFARATRKGFVLSLKQSCIAGSASDHTFRVSIKERRETMRTLLATLALSVALATPAVSATVVRHHDSRASNAYAMDRDVRPNPRARHSIIPRNDVYGSHGYVGSDPDPRVRNQLQHDQGQGLD
jgi:hypothetical protein